MHWKQDSVQDSWLSCIISLQAQFVRLRNLQACYEYFEVFAENTRDDEIPDFNWKHTIIVFIQSIS